ASPARRAGGGARAPARRAPGPRRRGGGGGGPGGRGGAAAVPPPARQARIHRSIVSRDTRTGSPNGPGCALAASSRTSRPRCRVDSDGSAASLISWYRNSATCSARAARLRSSSAPDMHNLLGKTTGISSPRGWRPYRGAAQSQLVLAPRAGQAAATSTPHVPAAASCHRATVPTPGTAVAAAAAAATAATASEIGDAAGAGSGGSVTRL